MVELTGDAQISAKCRTYLTLEANKRRKELLAIRDQRLEE